MRFKLMFEDVGTLERSWTHTAEIDDEKPLKGVIASQLRQKARMPIQKEWFLIRRIGDQFDEALKYKMLWKHDGRVFGYLAIEETPRPVDDGHGTLFEVY